MLSTIFTILVIIILIVLAWKIVTVAFRFVIVFAIIFLIISLIFGISLESMFSFVKDVLMLVF